MPERKRRWAQIALNEKRAAPDYVYDPYRVDVDEEACFQESPFADITHLIDADLLTDRGDWHYKINTDTWRDKHIGNGAKKQTTAQRLEGFRHQVKALGARDRPSFIAEGGKHITDLTAEGDVVYHLAENGHIVYRIACRAETVHRLIESGEIVVQRLPKNDVVIDLDSKGKTIYHLFNGGKTSYHLANPGDTVYYGQTKEQVGYRKRRHDRKGEDLQYAVNQEAIATRRAIEAKAKRAE